MYVDSWRTFISTRYVHLIDIVVTKARAAEKWDATEIERVAS